MQFEPSSGFDPSLFDDLKSLYLPPLEGKRFLNIGCGEGFFCGYAAFDGASESVGTDLSEPVIQTAKVNFPSCQFFHGDPQPEALGKFDVILYSANLHEASNQKELIDSLVSNLSDDGLLAMKVFIHHSKGNNWRKSEFEGKQLLCPNVHQLSEMLEHLAWKVVGYEARQTQKNGRGIIIHIRKMKPFAYLMLSRPSSGKSTISRVLFKKAGIPVVSGDQIYHQIHSGKADTTRALTELVRNKHTPTRIGNMTRSVLFRGLGPDLVDLWCKQYGYRDIAIDSYVPMFYRWRVRRLLAQKGYIPVRVNWNMPERPSSHARTGKKVSAFQRFLSRHAKKNNSLHE